MSETRSPRRVVLDTLVEFFRKERSRQYFVRRGPIHWPAHTFTEEQPYACAIIVDEGSLFRPEGDNHSIISIWQVTRATEGPGIDDSVIDAFTADAIVVLQQLDMSLDASGDSAALAIGWDAATVEEFIDSSTRENEALQGIHVQLAVMY